jgi:hypothetical protein
VARFPRQRECTQIEAANSERKKNPYGTDSVQQHVSQNLGTFIEPYRSYGHRTAATEILGAFFRGNGTAFNSGQAIPYGSLGTENECAVLWFLPVIFKHGKRGRDKFILLVLFFADVISRIEEIRRTPSLSLVFPTLGFFQGRFDQKFIVSLNVYLLS